jgi:hypothetical protein
VAGRGRRLGGHEGRLPSEDDGQAREDGGRVRAATVGAGLANKTRSGGRGAGTCFRLSPFTFVGQSQPTEIGYLPSDERY